MTAHYAILNHIYIFLVHTGPRLLNVIDAPSWQRPKGKRWMIVEYEPYQISSSREDTYMVYFRRNRMWWE